VKRLASSSFHLPANASHSRRGNGRFPAAKSRAAATAREREAEDGTNSSAHPSDTAVAPSTGSPLTQISAALYGPISRGRRCIPRIRDDAELHLGLPEERVLGHDPVMRAHREFVAASQREAVDQRHDGEGKVFKFRETEMFFHARASTTSEDFPWNS